MISVKINLVNVAHHKMLIHIKSTVSIGIFKARIKHICCCYGQMHNLTGSVLEVHFLKNRTSIRCESMSLLLLKEKEQSLMRKFCLDMFSYQYSKDTGILTYDIATRCCLVCGCTIILYGNNLFNVRHMVSVLILNIYTQLMSFVLRSLFFKVFK
jgi:hypothetical protein